MSLPLPEFLALAAACAPSIPPQTLVPVIRVESGFNPLAINVNGEPKIRVRARSRSEAVATAKDLIVQGRSVDLGLGQINSKNLSWLRLTVEDAFDPCRNLTAAARVLAEGYARASRLQPDPQLALRTAFSIYNTGHPQRGFDNGYVTKVTVAAGQVPAMAAPAGLMADRGTDAAVSSPPSAPSAAAPAAWDVFGRAGGDGFVMRPRRPAPADQPSAALGEQP